MRNLSLIFPLLLLLVSGSVFAAPPAKVAVSGTAEDWKGQSDNSEVHLGALAGLGMIDFNPGFVLLGTASKKIVHHGFVNEVTDSVSLETELGPLFTQGTTVFSYSLHLRWDFEMNEKLTVYALGGAGGYITGASFNNSFALFPRVGLGIFFRASDLILIRGEISHEVIAAGVTVPLYL